MPVHDWTQVDAGIFHDFHNAWTIEIRNALNGGLLPHGYYALTEQHTGDYIADVLALQTQGVEPETPISTTDGGVALAEAPPRVTKKETLAKIRRPRYAQRSVAIRHVSGHRRVALIEIVSPGNKDRALHVTEFVAKAVDLLQHGIHLLLLDLLPPGRHDAQGMHGALWRRLAGRAKRYDLPVEKPLTLSAYIAEVPLDAYINHLAVGEVLPEMPVFLKTDRYINVPLEATYQAAYQGAPAFWRKVLERPGN